MSVVVKINQNTEKPKKIGHKFLASWMAYENLFYGVPDLNIHYSAPQEIWDKIADIYTEMPEWRGFESGCPKWYGENGKMIEGSVEPSGLHLYGTLPQEEWDAWLRLFTEKATAALGYPIGELEDGYEFKIYD